MCLSHPLLFSSLLLCYVFFFLLGGLWQYLLHYAQTCRRENHKLFFLTDVLISLIPFWLWPGRKPENSKSVSSKLCAGVEKSIRCLSMPRIWMGERERKRKRPPNSRAISCYGSRRNQIQLLWIAIFINNLCYFISGLSHNVFFWLMQWSWAEGWCMVKQWEWPQRKWRAPSLH